MVRMTTVALLLLAGAAVGGCSRYAYGRGPSYDDYAASEDHGSANGDGDFPGAYGYFHDELDPYGGWYENERYGWVWSPEYVPAGWQPFLYGHWVYTDWGWAWVSDDPWSADTYHYGRWDCDASNRWFWVPGDVWAPAWVSWRFGGGYVGWAPLPPEADWSGTSLFYAVDLIPSARWCFVPEGRLTSVRVRTYVAPTPVTRRIYDGTRDVTRFAAIDGRPAERGLNPDVISRGTRTRIPEYRLVTRERGIRRDLVRGRTLVAPMPVLATSRSGPAAPGDRGRGPMRVPSPDTRVRSTRPDRPVIDHGDRGAWMRREIQRDRPIQQMQDARPRSGRQPLEERRRAEQARYERRQAEQAWYERRQAEQARYERRQAQRRQQMERRREHDSGGRGNGWERGQSR